MCLRGSRADARGAVPTGPAIPSTTPEIYQSWGQSSRKGLECSLHQERRPGCPACKGLWHWAPAFREGMPSALGLNFETRSASAPESRGRDGVGAARGNAAASMCRLQRTEIKASPGSGWKRWEVQGCWRAARWPDFGDSEQHLGPQRARSPKFGRLPTSRELVQPPIGPEFRAHTGFRTSRAPPRQVGRAGGPPAARVLGAPREAPRVLT